MHPAPARPPQSPRGPARSTPRTRPGDWGSRALPAPPPRPPHPGTPAKPGAASSAAATLPPAQAPRRPARSCHWLAKNASLICAHLCTPPPRPPAASSALTFLLPAAPARSGETRRRRRRRRSFLFPREVVRACGRPQTPRSAPWRRRWCRAPLPPGRGSGPGRAGAQGGGGLGSARLRWAQRRVSRSAGEDWAVTWREGGRAAGAALRAPGLAGITRAVPGCPCAGPLGRGSERRRPLPWGKRWN